MQIRSTLIVGTRDSILARLQTDMALKLLKEKYPHINFEINAAKTSGDKILNKPLAEMGGRGVFVKELEEALLEGSADLVVHSLKDLPTELPNNLTLAATLERADSRDVLLSKNNCSFSELPAGSRVATSSRRRAAQLSSLRTDLQFVDIRGNIQTRLRKLDEGQCDAMVLAAAGLLRLGLSERISQYFSPEESTPAVGQGALGIECRKDDKFVFELLSAINDQRVWACTKAERAFLKKLGGGCSVPVGAHAQFVSDNEIELKACVTSLDGKEIHAGSSRAKAQNAELLGESLAEQLISGGAAKIIEQLLNAAPGNVSPP
ncbi:MAG: hydroxymethylbilane synthase [Candidatus Obscuribacterales bacterium]|nr:hydroxymethylbilane synthase [Candidatus Obscuribacterales bacterium]